MFKRKGNGGLWSCRTGPGSPFFWYASFLYFLKRVVFVKWHVSFFRIYTAWGYAGGIEFYPMESNLHFFLAYVGRSYKYTDRAKALGEDNFSTHRVSVGFIWQMPVF